MSLFQCEKCGAKENTAMVADDEITVAKAEELIRAWVAGNYDKNCLPNV